MEKTDLTITEQIARAASRFEHSVRAVATDGWPSFLNADTMVITLHAALTAAEKAFAACPAGAAQVQDSPPLFTTAPTSLWKRIRRITGMQVREATAEVETTTGTVVLGPIRKAAPLSISGAAPFAPIRRVPMRLAHGAALLGTL